MIELHIDHLRILGYLLVVEVIFHVQRDIQDLDMAFVG